MIKQIAILRGINVGGRRKILMADLRVMFSNMGFINIVTYIQSGNVVFNSHFEESNMEIENRIQESILENFGFDVPVIIRSSEELRNTISCNPFIKNDDYDIERLYITFLKEEPAKDNLKNAMTFDYSPDKLEIVENNVFGYCAGRYSESKLTNKFFESKLKTTATTRNWKTVMKLSDLSE